MQCERDIWEDDVDDSYIILYKKAVNLFGKREEGGKGVRFSIECREKNSVLSYCIVCTQFVVEMWRGVKAEVEIESRLFMGFKKAGKRQQNPPLMAFP